MTGDENRALVEAIWQTAAEHIRGVTGGEVIAADVAAGLAVALADTFGERGGVMIVWWDSEGLKVNAAGYGESR